MHLKGKITFMDEFSSRKLLIQLVSARSENEVRKIIDSDPLSGNEENWKPYGGYESNFNTINNQAKNSVAALAEKPINSIDALRKRRLREGHFQKRRSLIDIQII